MHIKPHLKNSENITRYNVGRKESRKEGKRIRIIFLEKKERKK